MTLFGVVVFGISLSIRVCVARENEDGQRGRRSGRAHREGWLEAMQEEHDACARGKRERERERRRRKEVVRKDSERVRERKRDRLLYVQGTVTFPTLITVNH